MIIIAGAPLDARPNLLPIILSVCLLVTGCGAVGAGMQDVVPAPVFTSTPGTDATENSTYTYQIEATPAGGVTLALANAPSGATLNGNTLTWTPSAAQSRIPNQFSVSAKTTNGSATQSWIVTPVGTVSGTWIDTQWTASGPVLVPFDFTKVSIPPSALVPQPDGTFQTVIGSGNSDGTFNIPNIPGGYYWLRPALISFYWTSSSTFDFGTDLIGEQSKSTTSVATTTLQFNFSGLDPLQAQDEVAFLPVPAAPFFEVFSASAPVGATSLSAGGSISSNIDFSQIDTGLMLQYEPETFGGWSALSLGSEATVSNLALTNGAVNNISGTLNHAPQATFDLNVKGSAWAPLFENVGPGPATPLGSDFSVMAQQFVSGGDLLASGGSGVSLLFDPQPGPGLTMSSVCYISGPGGLSGFNIALPGEPPVTADIDFGPVEYGDPFPAAWLRVFTFCQTASLDVPIPGSASPIAFTLVDTQSISLPTSQIAPLISQVQNPTINGSSLFVAKTVSPTGVTLSWTAPNVAPPTGYKINVYVSGTHDGVVVYIPAGTFYTAKNSAMLPPLAPGQTYVFLISSVLDGLANFETSPNRSGLPTASVSVVSAPIAVSTGP